MCAREEGEEGLRAEVFSSFFTVAGVAGVAGVSGVGRGTERFSERFLGSVRFRPSSTSTSFPILCPDGASHTSPGCKPWELTRKRNPRSEGTPHNLRI